MTPDQISLVQSSFARLAPLADPVAAAFYERLFRIEPALRPMFAADLAPQRARLMQALAMVVGGLTDLPALGAAAATLGARHARYGVQPQHYATVGQALIDTLRDGLGADFDPAMEQAWLAAYSALAGAMQAGARATEPVPA